MITASYYTPEENAAVRCKLCPHHCLIKSGNYGECGVRYNEAGRLMAMTYGKIAAMHTDPVEKKPIYHYFPGSVILSIGSLGCNMHCNFCQNHQISQSIYDELLTRDISVGEIINQALDITENIGIAYTYNEPLTFFEFMMDVAKAASQFQLKNVMVSNGYFGEQVSDELIDIIDCFNIDLKSFSNEFYRTYASASLAPVLSNLKKIRAAGKHLELTFLVIPGLNDDPETFQLMLSWISDYLGRETPLHISRYFPNFSMNLPPTPVSKVVEMQKIASQKLDFAYTGNVNVPGLSDTFCPNCKQKLIERSFYKTEILALDAKGCCPDCGTLVIRM
jgi:pyruvate formate lyase activating enzyme